jgi:hypothetical protein
VAGEEQSRCNAIRHGLTAEFSKFANLVLQTTILILSRRFQENGHPRVWVLATLSKLSDFADLPSR